MKLRLWIAFVCVGLAMNLSVFSAGAEKRGKESARSRDFRALMQTTLDAWSTLDPANAAPFYAKEADHVFYDISPLKYTGWAEYAEGVKKVLESFSSLKVTLGEDAAAHQHGNLAWATATWHGDTVTKGGSKEAMEGRWTVVWEKRGRDWLIIHEHFSVPAPAPAETAGQPLYKRLGGYDAIAAVTDDFIGRMLKDQRLSKFFTSHATDSLHRIRQLVVDQLCQATGGPCFYIGRDMKTAHAGLGITEADWQTAVGHLTATLDQFKVPAKEKEEVLQAISGVKQDIVQR